MLSALLKDCQCQLERGDRARNVVQDHHTIDHLWRRLSYG